MPAYHEAGLQNRDKSIFSRVTHTVVLRKCVVYRVQLGRRKSMKHRKVLMESMRETAGLVEGGFKQWP